MVLSWLGLWLLALVTGDIFFRYIFLKGGEVGGIFGFGATIRRCQEIQCLLYAGLVFFRIKEVTI